MGSKSTSHHRVALHDSEPNSLVIWSHFSISHISAPSLHRFLLSNQLCSHTFLSYSCSSFFMSILAQTLMFASTSSIHPQLCLTCPILKQLSHNCFTLQKLSLPMITSISGLLPKLWIPNHPNPDMQGQHMNYNMVENFRFSLVFPQVGHILSDFCSYFCASYFRWAKMLAHCLVTVSFLAKLHSKCCTSRPSRKCRFAVHFNDWLSCFLNPLSFCLPPQ